MKEIGGYIELDTYNLPMLHESAIALNCGRNCLAYLFKSREIRRLKIPFFICESIIDVCHREGVIVDYYHIGFDFKPVDDLRLEDDEWLYLVNFYGQLTHEEISYYVDNYKRVIVDQANAYFEEPIPGVDTLYTCRKWFGVADGAFLYTDKTLEDKFATDESYKRMIFLLGRYERTANEFYADYISNNKYFINQPIKRMSKLTRNLLHGIDYRDVENKRLENFEHLQKALGHLNQLHLRTASFMYPFMTVNGATLRKRLHAKKIYVPTLWPSVFENADQSSAEYYMATNILPLPIDQRYGLEDMEYIANTIHDLL